MIENASDAWIDERMSALAFRRLEGMPWSAPADEDFKRLVATLGAPVSHEYRQFLSRYGAVLLGDEDFAVKAPISEPCPWGQQVKPGIFYPLLPGHPWSLEEQLPTYHGRIPDGVLPITHDAGGNLVCLDVAGRFPDSVWFWDHEQRWFASNLQDAAEELDTAGLDARRLSVHGIIREWARRHPAKCDRPPDYMGMYRMAPSFAKFLRGLFRVSYDDVG